MALRRTDPSERHFHSPGLLLGWPVNKHYVEFGWLALGYHLLLQDFQPPQEVLFNHARRVMVLVKSQTPSSRRRNRISAS